MTSTVRWVCLIASVWLMSVSTVHGSANPIARALPGISVMPGMKVHWIAEHMVYNGVPMSIRKFSINAGIDDVKYFYENEWKMRGNGIVSRARQGEYHVLGATIDNAHLSLQVRHTVRGAEGSLVVSLATEDIGGERETEFPIVPGSQLISVVESQDNGVWAETLVALNERSLASNERWIRQALRRDGWVFQPFGSFNPNANQWVLDAQRGSELTQITILANSPVYLGKTAIIVNWIKGR